ncbi:PKD repeat protein [Methanolinea mesophila]|uniref:PKD domain-containing protein n=1 Tax=Methanolinea mesophila TaxID=547055 RepID=UPI001AE45DC5|nr:PKD domain-containing protein [Methanolinea mesophila]MBP1929675.1 PKD repeat protein [Methanolinea mesophila]
MDKEEAISRNILLIVIVAVAVIVIGAVIVMVLFPPHPDVVPQFSANVETSGNLVYLYHDGGDALYEDTTILRINGLAIPASNAVFLHGQDWPWTAGKTLQVAYPGTDPVQLVQVIYSSGSTQELVYSTEVQGPQTTPIPISTVATSLITPTVSATGATPVMTTPAETVTPPIGPSVPQPPVPAFTASPRSGESPLQVRFTDLSSGVPTSWIWNFGDGTSSIEQNPLHTYSSTGVYSVALTVENAYGTNTRTINDYIAVGIIPEANFVGTPRDGPAPMTVQFNDLSSGSPDRWTWDFGDGEQSVLRNPSHVYLKPGSYTVTLTAANTFGSNTRIQSNYIHVSETMTHNVYLQNSVTGYLLPDGYLQFVVGAPAGNIKIAGHVYQFQEGDKVQLFIGEVPVGEIDVAASGINTFYFDGVRMYVNGILVEKGTVSSINVPAFDGLVSTLGIRIPPGETGYTLFVDESRVSPSSTDTVTFSDLRQDSSGRMYYIQKVGTLTYVGGAGGVTIG